LSESGFVVVSSLAVSSLAVSSPGRFVVADCVFAGCVVAESLCVFAGCVVAESLYRRWLCRRRIVICLPLGLRGLDEIRENSAATNVGGAMVGG
jgi:hypothetical protein